MQLLQLLFKRQFCVSLFFICLAAGLAAQEMTVSGQVTEAESGDPLTGVNIVVEGSSTGTVSDIDGNYTIEVPDGEATLVFSYIGYQPKQVPVNGQSTINVALESDVEALDEVVVVGYGTQQRRDVTGSVSTVNVEELESVPLTNVDQALQGRVPGVTVTQTSGGAPGGAFQVNIRGIGSINSETPLYVIDGIPVQESGRDANSTSFLNSLNPNDIASIDILKDASAAAIYGSRASGGVIIITTKRGREGPARVDFNSYYGWQVQDQFYDVLNADQYVSYLRDLHSGPDGELPAAFDGTQPPHDTDWQEELFGNSPAPIQNYNLSISGGNQNATFSLGLEYFDQEGTMVGTGFDRFSIRANSDYNIGERIKIGETLLLSKTNRLNYAGAGGRQALEHAIKQAPTVPVYDDTFLNGFGFPDVDEGQDAQNPIANALIGFDNTDLWRAWTSLYGEVEILKGLTYKLQLGLDFSYAETENYNPEIEQVRRLRDPSSLAYNRNQNVNPLLEQYLTYTNQFGQHSLTAMVGFSAQEFSSSGLSGAGQELPPGIIDLDGAATNITNGSFEVETSLRSVFGRLSYDFADKYLLTANIRRDESSKLFRSNNPDGVFPSASVAWRVSKENFMQDIGWISDLKLRGGYGLLGNQTPLSAFPADVALNTNFFYVFGDQVVQGVSQLELANPNINWETTEQWDIGLDLEMFEGKFYFQMNYYDRTTEDLISRAAIPSSVGLGAPFVNNGVINNNGFEFGATYRKYEGNFNFDISANLTTVNNEVVSLQNEDTELFSGSVTDDINNVSLTRVGEPIGSFYGWVSDGIFQNWDEVYNHALINQAQNPDGSFDTEARDEATAASNTAPGDIKWRDINGDGVVDGDDRTILGSPIPDFTAGLTVNASYKGFDAQLFVQGVYGHQIYNAAKRWLIDFRQNFNQGIEALDRWTPSNPSNTTPRAVRSDPNQNVLRSSDRYVYDGDYTRIKNLTLGYTFGGDLLQRANITRLRIYATAQNLATFTDYFGLEPEVGSRDTGTARDAGIDRLLYPQPRTFLFGVQLGF